MSFYYRAQVNDAPLKQTLCYKVLAPLLLLPFIALGRVHHQGQTPSDAQGIPSLRVRPRLGIGPLIESIELPCFGLAAVNWLFRNGQLDIHCRLPTERVGRRRSYSS